MCSLEFSIFLGRNSVLPQFWVGGDEGSKMQNLLLFESINTKSKVVRHITK